VRDERHGRGTESAADIDGTREARIRRAAAAAVAGAPESLPSAGSGPAGGDPLRCLARAPLVARAAALARLQRATGNASLARRISPAEGVLQRAELDGDGAGLDLDESELIPLDQDVAGPAGVQARQPAAAAPARPAVTTLTRNCADCNAAVALLAAAGYFGEANVQATWGGVGDIQVTKAKQGYVATVGIRWSIDAATSTMEVTEFAWPNMTGADTAAVASYRSLLQAHEEGHFAAVEAAIATLPKTVTGRGASKQLAVAALKAQLPRDVAAGQAAIDAATATYEGKTHNGRTQSAVGGTNVMLHCPGTAPAP
jgi:hypothetical protein